MNHKIDARTVIDFSIGIALKTNPVIPLGPIVHYVQEISTNKMYHSSNSLKSYILGYVRNRYPEFVHKGDIGKKAVNEWGFENENAGRRCRELVNEGKFEPKLEKSHGVRCVMYKWIPPKEETIKEMAMQGVFG